MISILFSRMMIIVCGTLFPAYKSYKAVRMKDAKEYMKWMMYWIAFALFCVFESFADVFVSFWFPFYYEMKIVFVFWLVSPWTKGATILYRKWIHPTLMKHEDEIDRCLEKAKAETYSQAVNVGRRGLTYAREVVANAAIRGQAHIAEQLLLPDPQPTIEPSPPPVPHHSATTTRRRQTTSITRTEEIIQQQNEESDGSTPFEVDSRMDPMESRADSISTRRSSHSNRQTPHNDNDSESDFDDLGDSAYPEPRRTRRQPDPAVPPRRSSRTRRQVT